MHSGKTGIALAVSFALAPPGLAQSPASKPAAQAPTWLAPVVVTGNPLGSELFNLAPPVSVLSGLELTLKRSSTLGETLSGLPGVSASGFGPNVSRPVIRGLDADRIRILSNGSGVLDASSLSYDHDVAVDPLVMERAEVVRGPVALLYGGSAVGGVVNVIDNRIPQSPVTGATGRVESRIGGADREKALSGVLEVGNGRVSVHADAYTRDTDDLRIKGFARWIRSPSKRRGDCLTARPCRMAAPWARRWRGTAATSGRPMPATRNATASSPSPPSRST